MWLWVMMYELLIIKRIRIAYVNCDHTITGDRAAIVHKFKSVFQPIDYKMDGTPCAVHTLCNCIR